MSFTAAVAAHLLGSSRSLKIGLWIWFAVTLASTIYLGWHYVLDDLGGVILGAMALALAAALTGVDLRKGRARRRATSPLGTTGWGGDYGLRRRSSPLPRAARRELENAAVQGLSGVPEEELEQPTRRA